MERTDNLRISFIENKRNFLLEFCENTDILSKTIVLNAISFESDWLVNYNVTEVSKQIQSNEYIWLLKEHI